ncbi:MAG: T9SS type A sorting domain-containing protein [Bacteroidota bacterium]
MINKLFKIFLVIIVFYGSSVIASNYYLDPVNGLISNDGSSENPWNELKMVLLSKTINDGDTLILRSGYHGNNFSLTGSHSLPVVIKADEGHTPYMFKINVVGSNWLLDGILFTPEWNRGYESPGSFENGVLLTFGTSSENNVVQDCEFRSAYDTRNWSIQNWRDSVWSGIRDYGIDNITQSNHFKNVAYAITLMSQAQNAHISKNFIEIYSGDGIRNAGANNTVIEYNTVCNAVELDADHIVGNHEDGIQGWGDSNGLIVRGNYVYSDTGLDTIPFVGPIQGIVIFDGSTTNAVFENNVVVTEHWHGITVLGSYNSKYINNTVLPVPNISATQGPPWIRIDAKKDGTSSSGNIIRNNVATDLVVEYGSSVSDHNVISRNVFNLLNDYNNWDFAPATGSSQLVDAGSADGAPSVDILGVERPQGDGYDIGAYEVIGGLIPSDSNETSYQQDFNSDVDTSFWANNWAGGKISADRDGETFQFITNSLDNYYLGVILDFKGSKDFYLNLRNNPYISIMAKVDVGATINDNAVDSLPIGMDLINPQGNNISYFYTYAKIAADGEWHKCLFDFSSIAFDAGMDSVAKVRFNPGKDRNDGGVSYSGTVWIDDFKAGEAAVYVDPDDPVVFSKTASLSDKFYTTWTVTPTHSPMDGVTGLAKGEVATFSNMGILVRFKDNKVDAYNGSGYEAENELIFEANKNYSIKVIADVKAQTYSIDVTPEGTIEPIRIGTDFVFRSYNSQDTLNYFAMVINELEVWGGVPDSRLNPSFMEDDYELNFVSNNAVNPQTGTFTTSFDLIPTAQSLNSSVSLLKGEAIMDGWSELSAIIRLNDQNKFDVRDGSQYTADADLAYTAGTKYSILMHVNVPAQTYSVSITPEGGSEVTIATDYEFRASADTIKTFAQLTIIGGIHGGSIGEVLVSDFEITTTDVNEFTSLPKTFSLEQNYPNPFNPSTKIKYSLAKQSKIKLIVYNSLGETVKTLVDDFQKSGIYTVDFNASGLSSGIYFYRLTTDGFNSTKKMLLLR